jgi:hypothetical protein
MYELQKDTELRCRTKNVDETWKYSRTIHGNDQKTKGLNETMNQETWRYHQFAIKT